MDLEKLKNNDQTMLDGIGGVSAAYKRILQQKVYISLYFRAKRNEESISFVSGDKIFKFMYEVDLYTETGIAKLKIPPYSCFELKERLVSDSVYRISEFAKEYRKKHPESKIYLLYQDRGMLTEQVEKEAKKQKLVEIYQIDEFISKTNKVSHITDQIEHFEQKWKDERDSVLDLASYAFRENNCSFFLGAGVSIDAGGPSWEELLRSIIRKFKRLGRKTDFYKVYGACGQSPIILGRYVASSGGILQSITEYLQRYVLYNNVRPDKSELLKAICEAVKGPGDDERIVAAGRVDSIITYNYDDLVETALEKNGVRVARIYLKSRNVRGELPVYHVHGLIPQEKKDIVSTPILGEREYHEMYREAYSWSNVEQLHALDRNTCFFIGMSMTDPNLRRLLDISHSGSDKDYKHFAFLKREPLFKDEEVDKNKKHFSTIEFQLNDLGIQVIWYEQYDEIPKMLRRIIAPMRYII